jgi:hypothetical protein
MNRSFFKTLKLANAAGHIRDFVSFDLGGHDFQARNCSDCQICQNWDLGTPVANHTKQKALRDVMVVLVAFFFFCYIC